MPIGIKHGIGLCGGSAHTVNFPFDIDDKKLYWLKQNVRKESFEFYKSMEL